MSTTNSPSLGQFFGSGDGDEPELLQIPNPAPAPNPAPDPTPDPAPASDPKKDDDPDPGSQNDDDDDDGLTIWNDVDALRGREIPLNLPDNVPVNSPEAVLLFEKAVRDDERAALENAEKERDPRAYAYKLHREKGGSDEEFFRSKSSVLPDEDSFMQSLDLQKSIYQSSLMKKGLSQVEAELLVETAVTNKTIQGLSKAAYDDIKATEKKELDEIQQSVKQTQDANMKVGQALIQESSKLVNENSLSIRIPEEEKKSFLDFFQDNIIVDNGKAWLSLEVGSENLTVSQTLEQLYLMFKKHDLNQLVKTQAVSAKIRELKRKASTPGAAPDPQKAPNKQTTSSPLLEMIPD